MTLTLTTNREFGIDIPEGGTLVWSGDGAVPGTLGTTDTGAILGPLECGIPEDHTLELASVEFTAGPSEEDDDGLLGIGVLGMGAVAAVPAYGASEADSGTNERTSTEVTRRGAMGALAAIGLGLLATDTTMADEDEEVTLSVATIEVEEAEGPWSLRVLGLVDDVLPTTSELLIDQSGTRVGSIGTASDRTDIQPETGEVRVYVRDSLGNLTELLAWASSWFDFDETISFRRTFPNDQQASDYSEDALIRLTEHPAIVGPVEDAGPDATRFTINNTTIPHVDGRDSEAGAWDIVGESIVYEVGPNPPAEEEYELETRLGLLERQFS